MSDLVEALRTFVRVAERQNFSVVATEMNATHTTVARRVDFLEQHFSSTLLRRSTRRLTLTDEGERLVERARGILEQVELAEADMKGRRAVPEGVVRIGVTTALGLYYAERLGPLRRRFPRLRIEFSVADWQGNMTEEGLDLALMIGQFPSDSLAVHPLGSIHRYLVAAPAYLAESGTPSRPEDLRSHECIVYGYGPTRTAWEVGGANHYVSGGFKANSSEAVHRAVLSGLGIGLLPVIQVQNDIDAGRLIRVLENHEVASLSLSVAHVASATMPPRIAAALEFLKSRFPL